MCGWVGDVSYHFSIFLYHLKIKNHLIFLFSCTFHDNYSTTSANPQVEEDLLEFYAWVDAPGWRQLFVPSRPPMTLCFVDSSHSRLLAQYAQRIDKSKVVKY